MLANQQPQEENVEAPPPLTKEEKKKLKILQKKKDREALITRINIEDLQREIDMSKKTYGLASKKWKEICMKEGKSEYKDWMMEQWCLFEHLISIKDETIRQLVEDLDKAKDSARNRYQEHAEYSDKLIKCFLKRIKDMTSDMEQQKELLLKKREKKLENIMADYEYMDDYMKTILFILQKTRNEKEIAWSAEFISKTDEELNKNQNEFEMMCSFLEKRLHVSWKEYVGALQDYAKDTEITLKKTDSVKKRVFKEDRLIKEQVKKMFLLQTATEKDKEWLSKGEPMANELRPLRIERDDLTDLYLKLKKELNSKQKYNQIRLKFLVATSNNALKYLNTLNELGEKIIKFYKMSTRLETVRENSDPFVRDIPQSFYLYTNVEAVNKMTKFWKRVGRAEMVKHAMKIKRNQLREKNNELKARLDKILRSQQLAMVLQDLEKCT